MNNFLAGMLAFPTAITALAITVGAVMWAMNRARKWSEESTARLDHQVQLPAFHEFSSGKGVMTVANLNKRDVLAELVTTSRRARLVSFGANFGLIVIHGGKGPFTAEESAIFRKAYAAAVQELGEKLVSPDADADAEDTAPEPEAAEESREKAADAS